jgi:hypothetical protein
MSIEKRKKEKIIRNVPFTLLKVGDTRWLYELMSRTYTHSDSSGTISVRELGIGVVQRCQTTAGAHLETMSASTIPTTKTKTHLLLIRDAQ